jgi:GTPase SAR1 family protein
MYKLALTGSHGTGKTTKIEELYDHFVAADKMVYVVQEVARSCPLKLGTIPAQEWIWREQLNREKIAEQQDVDIVLYDRIALDNLIYFFDLIPDGDQKLINHWRFLYQEAVDHVQKYDQIVRLSLNIDWLSASNDPIRPKDIVYAKRIDRLFDRFVQPFVTSCEVDYRITAF